MANKLHVDQEVLVPSFLVPDGERLPHSMFKTKIVEIVERSVRIELRTGQSSELIAASKIHDSIGIAIISIGDFSTESSLIDPLSTSVLQFCRLLLPDDRVVSVKLRAIGEFGEWWKINHALYTHVVIIGHGTKNGITFAVGGERKAISFRRRLTQCGASKKIFISLCCESGRIPFAKEFSSLSFCQCHPTGIII